MQFMHGNDIFYSLFAKSHLLVLLMGMNPPCSVFVKCPSPPTAGGWRAGMYLRCLCVAPLPGKMTPLHLN